LVVIILFDDIDLDNRILVYNTFATLAIAGFLFSYSLTKKNLLLKLAMGKTRRAIYLSYLRKTILSLFVSLLLAAFYMLIYNLILKSKFSFMQVFDFREIIFLPLVYLVLSSLGFFLGIYKVQSKVFYILTGFIIAALVLLIIYFSVAYWLTLTLFLFTILFGVFNYLLFMKYDL
jgi:hypothetical protein